MNICCWLWKITCEFRKVFWRVHIGSFHSENDNKYRCYTEEGEMILHVACLLYDIRLGVYISENKHTGLSFLYISSYTQRPLYIKSSLFTVAYQRITGIVSIKCKDPSTEAWNLALTFSPWTSLRYIFSLKTHLKVRDKCTPGWQIKW